MKLLIKLGMNFVLITLCWGGVTQKEYIVINKGENLTSSSIQHSSNTPSLIHIQQPISQQVDSFKRKSNQLKNYKNQDTTYPNSFLYGTNSYWLNPGFQFGPGSSNDLGGNPNAEQMLQPFFF